MIIPVKCFTCGMVLADKYRFYQEEVRKRKLAKSLDVEKVIYLTREFHEKTPEGEVLDEMNLTSQNFKNKCISMGTDYVCDDANKMFDLSTFPPINIEIRNGLILKDKLNAILNI